MLAHPAIKAAITHCGFGGTLELISQGIPTVVWPHFGDQHINADLLKKAGAATVLYYNKRLEKPADALKIHSYEEPIFTSQKVTECVKEVLSQPKYKQAAMRLRMLSKGMGGRDLVVKTIERFYITGSDHLVDETFNRKYNKMNCFCSFMSILVLLGILSTLTFFTVKYFEIKK